MSYEFVKDADESVRFLAAETLGHLGDSRGVKWLIARAVGTRDALASVGALERILEQATRQLDTETLQAVAHLESVAQLQYSFQFGSEAPTATEIAVDCSQVRKLALEELLNRGQTA